MNKRVITPGAAMRSSGLVIVLAFCLCEGAWATGFFINQQSVKGLGRVDAGNTAAADELGTIFFNPAGLTELWRDPKQGTGIKMSLATHVVIPRGDQVNRGSVAATPGSLGTFVPVGGGNSHDPTDPTPIPNFYVAMPLAQGQGAIGFGFNVPFGLATQFDPGWHGRYDAIEASLRTYNYSFVGAWRFDSGKPDTGWSIGGGLDIQYARTSLTTAIPNPFVPGGPTAATDAQVQSSGHAYTPGFNVGVLYRFNADDRVGLHYRSEMKHDIKGRSGFGGFVGPLAAFNGAVDVRADVNLPAIATAGFRKRLTPELVLLGEFEWFEWSSFREVRIRFADGRPDGVRPTNFRDTYAVALGAEYQVNPQWTARGGVQYDRTPTVDAFRDTTVPDSDRLWLGLGATYRASRNWSFDFAFNHVFFKDTRIALTRTFFDGTPLASAARINSDVSTVTNTLSVDFRYAF